MSIFTAWTTGQWSAFAALSIAGLSALALAGIAARTVRGWTAPALYRTAPAATPRPSITAAAHRAILPPPPGPLDPRSVDPAYLAEVAVPLTEALAAQHLADAIRRHDGSGRVWERAAESQHADIAAEEGHLERVELVDPEISAMFGAFEDAMRRDIDARFAAPLLTAIVWAIEGAEAGVSGAVALDGWRTGSDTGEWPMVGGLALLC